MEIIARSSIATELSKRGVNSQDLPSAVEAVVKHNGLSNAEAVQDGQVLVFPDALEMGSRRVEIKRLLGDFASHPDPSANGELVFRFAASSPMGAYFNFANLAQPQSNEGGCGYAPSNTHVDACGYAPSSHVDACGYAPSSHVDACGYAPSNSHVDACGYAPSSHVDACGYAPSNSHVDACGYAPSSHVDACGSAPSSHVDACGYAPSNSHVDACGSAPRPHRRGRSPRRPSNGC